MGRSATYTVPSGRLKGFAGGGGVNFRGRSKVGAASGNAFDYLYAPSYGLVSAHLNYSRRIGKINARFQLNVANLLNEDMLVTTAYNTYRVGNLATNPLLLVPSAYRYHEPRKATLSVNLGF